MTRVLAKPAKPQVTLMRNLAIGDFFRFAEDAGGPIYMRTTAGLTIVTNEINTQGGVMSQPNWDIPVKQIQWITISEE